MARPYHSQKPLRSFLGLAGYYRRFVWDYATLVELLTDLLKKNTFYWFPAATTAFQALQQAPTNIPVLRLPDFTLSFELHYDASGVSVGTVLM